MLDASRLLMARLNKNCKKLSRREIRFLFHLSNTHLRHYLQRLILLYFAIITDDTCWRATLAEILHRINGIVNGSDINALWQWGLIICQHASSKCQARRISRFIFHILQPPYIIIQRMFARAFSPLASKIERPCLYSRHMPPVYLSDFILSYWLLLAATC